MSAFHSLQGLTQAEITRKDVKEFVGDGSPFLKVPGLSSLTYVRVGGLEIPLEHTQTFPVGNTTEKEKITEPLFVLEHDSNGEAILLRSKQSNHGLWQKDIKIYVGGDWDGKAKAPKETKEPEAEASDAEKLLRSKTNPELFEIAKERGVTVDPKANKDQLVAAILGSKE